MMRFMQEGGWGSWFVMILALMALVGAVLFARSPDRRGLAYLRGITVATVFSTLTGVCAGFSATLHHLADPAQADPDWYRWLLLGLGESLTIGILGFGLLAVVWLVASVGLRRMAAG